MNNKKIIIAGGTGFIGDALVNHFGVSNKVIVLTRGIKNVKTNSFRPNTDLPQTHDNVSYIIWDAEHLGDWTKEIENADLVINLSGKTVNCRYNKKNKKEILDSRVNASKVLGEAIQKSIHPPRLWVNASSATIYRHATDRPQDELTGDIQNDFSVQVCKLWEKAFFEHRTAFTRKVALRMP